MTFVMPNNWLQRTALRAAAEPRRYKRGRVITVMLTEFGTAYANEAKPKVNTTLITNVRIFGRIKLRPSPKCQMSSMKRSK